MHNFVESDVKIGDVRSAIDKAHIHPNKGVLDNIVSDGESTKYLGADGNYHDVPALFDVQKFLGEYNQESGNVKAAADGDGKLILNTVNTFAYQTDGKVVGAIEVEQATDKQLNVSIAEVDVNTGGVSENPIHYIKTGNGLSVGFSDNTILIGIVPTDEPFVSKMDKQVSAVTGAVGVFDANGQVVDSGVSLSDLVTESEFTAHANDEDKHVTEELQNAWNAKQSALTVSQLAAVDSGIDASKVAQYDAYATTKQSVGGNTPNMALETDGAGNIVMATKFDPNTKISVVTSAGVDKIPIFNSAGGIKDSEILLGAFDPALTLKEYLDTSMAMHVAGASYRGAYNYFGTMSDVSSLEGMSEGDTVLVFEEFEGELQSMTTGVFNGVSWDFEESLSPPPVGGNWFEVDYLLTLGEPVAGRVVVRMDGHNPATLDVRPTTSIVLDGVTLDLNNLGQAALKKKLLNSGKSVLNSVSADNLEYGFRGDGIKTVKEILEEVLQYIDSH